MCAVVVVADPPMPNFPLDWTSQEQDLALMYQGSYTQNGDNYCCAEDNCEVQTQYQSGHNYFDFTHNRTRFDDPVQGSIVSLFAPLYMEMAVDGNNKCTSYCPIEDDLEAYGVPDNSTYNGTAVVNGITCDDWQYKETLFGVVVMEIDEFFVDQTTQLPLQEIDVLTPFGEQIGDMTTTYLQFIPGTPDAKLFAVTGIKDCPQDNNCGQDYRQFVRLRNGAHKTWLKHHQLNKMAKNAARTTKRRSHIIRNPVV
jgi:hypothetical protein